MDNKLTLIKVFLQAKTKEELVVKQLRNNMAHGLRFIYDTPMKDGKNWVVWYFADVEDQMLKEQLRKKVE